MMWGVGMIILNQMITYWKTKLIKIIGPVREIATRQNNKIMSHKRCWEREKNGKM